MPDHSVPGIGGIEMSTGSGLEFRDIRKTFGDHQVLDGISLDVRPGEFMTLLGPSGCGKSTLLRIAAGLDEASSGRVFIDRRPVDGLPPKARGVAMVFQNYALYPHMTAFQNIATPLRMERLALWQRLPVLRRISSRTHRSDVKIREDVFTAGRLVGIESLLGRKPGQLSGGQRQRVALGRAIVRRPAVFLMDEPLSNLDVSLRAQMRFELAKLHRSLNATFIYVTHDQIEAMTLSDRVAVMMDGKILQVDTPAAIYDSPAHLDVARFVGTPPMNILEGRTRQDGRIDVHDILFSGLSNPVSGTSVRVGVRAEDIEITDTKPSTWGGIIRHIENLGPDLLLYVSLGDGEPLVAIRTDRRRSILPMQGEAISFRVTGSAHAFDDHGRCVGTLEPARDLQHV
jgi:multiple sugar transport system ATP-binding protein